MFLENDRLASENNQSNFGTNNPSSWEKLLKKHKFFLDFETQNCINFQKSIKMKTCGLCNMLGLIQGITGKILRPISQVVGDTYSENSNFWSP